MPPCATIFSLEKIGVSSLPCREGPAGQNPATAAGPQRQSRRQCSGSVEGSSLSKSQQKNPALLRSRPTHNLLVISTEEPHEFALLALAGLPRSKATAPAARISRERRPGSVNPQPLSKSQQSEPAFLRSFRSPDTAKYFFRITPDGTHTIEAAFINSPSPLSLPRREQSPPLDEIDLRGRETRPLSARAPALGCGGPVGGGCSSDGAAGALARRCGMASHWLRRRDAVVIALRADETKTRNQTKLSKPKPNLRASPRASVTSASSQVSAPRSAC